MQEAMVYDSTTWISLGCFSFATSNFTSWHYQMCPKHCKS